MTPQTTAVTEGPVNWLQALVARGAVRPPEPVPPVRCVITTDAGNCRVVAEHDLDDLAGSRGGLGTLFPTYVGRCELDQQAANLAHVRDQLDEVHRAYPDLPLTLWVGMQWRDGEEPEALRRLHELAEVAAPAPWLRYIGLSLPGPGKLRTTNAAIRLSAGLGLLGWIWIDDDISMEPHCLRELVAHFLTGGARGALGATKVAESKSYRSSKLMVRLGRLTAPHRDYPHACCMLVAADVVHGGIRGWLGSDDGHVLFKLLDPALPDPFAYLKLVPTARCRYYQGARTGETFRRLQNALYSHLLHSATHPWPVSRAYLSETLFYGLWPLAPWDGRRGPALGAARWLVKAVHFGWFAATGATLIARGIVNRPIAPSSPVPFAEHWVPDHGTTATTGGTDGAVDAA